MKPENNKPTHFCASCERLIPVRYRYCVTCKARLDKQEKDLHASILAADGQKCGPCERIPMQRKCPTCPDLVAGAAGYVVQGLAEYSAEQHYADLKARGLVQGRAHFEQLFKVPPAEARTAVLAWVRGLQQ